MGNLGDLFVDLQKNKGRYLASTKGGDFEDRIDTKLHQIGFSRVQADDLRDASGGRERFKALKEAVLDKGSNDKIVNGFRSEFGRHFIVQPFGSQNYPDFLVFSGATVVGIETKFSATGTSSPVWNSGLPRPNGIYVFGATGRRDLTFFCGGDILSAADARQLHDFFEQLKKHQEKFNKERMSGQPYGFAAYVRKAFEQKRVFNKSAVLDLFSNPKRDDLETAVIQRFHRR